jgi:hypothetical protein
MHYEYEIRSKACSLMNRGDRANGYVKMDIAAALAKAQGCPDLRMKEFLEKLTCQTSNGPSSSGSVPANGGHGKGARKAKQAAAEARKLEGGGKGVGKAPKTVPKIVKKKGGKPTKGGGKSMKNKLNLKHHGKEICFAWQTGKCKGDCGREHVCQICLDKHTNANCPSKED